MTDFSAESTSKPANIHEENTAHLIHCIWSDSDPYSKHSGENQRDPSCPTHLSVEACEDAQLQHVDHSREPMQQCAGERRRLKERQAVSPGGPQQGEGAKVQPPAAEEGEHSQLQTKEEGHLQGGQEVAEPSNNLQKMRRF
jgi:hypothetical protein